MPPGPSLAPGVWQQPSLALSSRLSQSARVHGTSRVATVPRGGHVARPPDTSASSTSSHCRFGARHGTVFLPARRAGTLPRHISADNFTKCTTLASEHGPVPRLCVTLRLQRSTLVATRISLTYFYIYLIIIYY